MLNITNIYQPSQPNPKGDVWLSPHAWNEALEFGRNHVAWPPGANPEEQTARHLQEFIRQFYTSRWFDESKWFRTTSKHSVLVMSAGGGITNLRQICTVCADGVAVVSFGEVHGDTTYGLDDSYFARRIIEETLVQHRESFARRPSGG